MPRFTPDERAAYAQGKQERDKSVTCAPSGPPLRDRWLEGWANKAIGALR